MAVVSKKELYVEYVTCIMLVILIIYVQEHMHMYSTYVLIYVACSLLRL